MKESEKEATGTRSLTIPFVYSVMLGWGER